MEIRIGRGAEQVLDRHPGFKIELLDELKTQQFAYVCFIEEFESKGALEIKCLGGQGIVVPETSFHLPGTLARITTGLASAIK
jgi:hypothetical protein